MSGGGVSPFPSASLLDSVSFCFSPSSSSSFFNSHFLSPVSISVVIPLPLLPSSLSSLSQISLSRSLRGFFHLDLQTPPPGATLITYGGK